MASNTLNGMRRGTLALGALLLVAFAAGEARADLTSGRDKLLHGDYDGARKDFAAVTGKDRQTASLLIARLDLRLGKHLKAERRAKVLARTRKAAQRADARVLVAEVYLATGRYTEAIDELVDVVKVDPGHLRGRYQLAMAYRCTGKLDLAAVVWESFWADYAAEKLRIENPQHALHLALAARYLSSFEDANESFREAVTTDANLLEANLEWGYLLLDKYAVGDAEQSFDDVLKIDAKHPDAHAGMAVVKLEQSYAVATARQHIEEALAVNPKHAPSLLVRAMLEIDANEWAAAKATLTEVLAVNPNEVEARAMVATIAWLRDDQKTYEKEKQAVFKVNPTYAEFFHIVARSAVREHRYKQAIELEEAAVKIDPQYYVAMQAIGSGYLRLGQEKRGVEWLLRAWEGDGYNVRTHNLLELFEEVIPKQYEFSSSKHFKLRYHKDERKLLERYVEPLLEKAYASMTKRYGFEPAHPTTIELFRNPENYSVRTVGLPNLGALGVCFGRVITAMSPSSGNMNWSMVLWHELGHVYAIQISNSRVPRWYTEGLSEYETIIARPEWRRENDVDVWAALEAGTLPSVADLNHGFLKPTLEEVVVAYHTSSLTIEFIADTYGFDKIVEGLKLYGKGLETPEVIEKITGLTVAQFDRKFRKFLTVRFAHYQGTFRLPTVGFDDMKKLEAEAAAASTDSMAQARLGLGYYYAGDADSARSSMMEALRYDSKNSYALYVMGELLLRQRDYDAAKIYYKELIDTGRDGYEPRVRLGFIAIQKDDVAEAETQLGKAKQLDPERSDPYILLAELYEKNKRKAESLAEYEKYVLIEQMQYSPVKHLVDAHAKQRNWKKVRKYGELAVNINPNDGEMLLDLGRAYFETKAARKSAFTYESALLARSKLRRPALAHVGIARAMHAVGETKQAKAAIQKALQLEPRNRAALKLQKQLKGKKRGRKAARRRAR